MRALAGSVSARSGKDGRQRLHHLLDDGNIMRGAFFALLAAAVVTLVLDYREMAEANAFAPDAPMIQPILPSTQAEPGESGSEQPQVTTDPDMLRQAMRIELGKGGTLRLEGTITPGTSARFAKEIGKVGEYVKRIELDSPGGSAQDALAMSRLVRENGYDTVVRKGQLCASSCPLVFAGGVTREAEEGAAVGVHQVFPASEEGLSPRAAASGTQSVTAQVTRLLTDMGVDAALWLHALDTPPERLYYLSPEEMKRYRLTGTTKKKG